MDINNVYNQKSEIELTIRQLKLQLYAKEFELSEIKNYIRKNCTHEWSESNSIINRTDIEMGNLSINKQKCVKCNEYSNELELI